MVDIPLDLPPRRAVALSPCLGPLVRHGGGFGVFLLLAAVIGPRQYGLFLLALSGVAIVSALLSKSVSCGLDNVATPDDRHWSTALVTLIVAGTALSLIVSVVAFLMGPLIDDALFGDLLRSLTILPFLEAMAVVPRAALRREGRSAPLKAADIGGMAAGGCVAAWLAWAGTGAWSLVAQIVVQRLVECVVLWAFLGKRIGILWSWRHFADLCRMLDWAAAAAVLAKAKRPAVLLLVGMCLGPTAAGFYMLAAWPAEALRQSILAGAPRGSVGEIVSHVCRLALPAVLAGAQMAVALPPVLDLRWWGAVAPAQIAVFAVIPAALICVRTACGEVRESKTQRLVLEAIGAITVTSLVAAHGLVAVISANIAWSSAVAILSPCRKLQGYDWHPALRAAIRPCVGAVAAGILLLLLAEPVALRLAPIPALCLLTGSGWLVYLLIRGDPVVTRRHPARGVGDVLTAP
jgi:hypothetical protein